MSGCYHFCSQVKRQFAFLWTLEVCFIWAGFTTDGIFNGWTKSETINFFFFRGKMYSCQVWSVTNRSEMNKNVTRMRTKFEKKTKRRKDEKISVDLMILGCNPVSRALSYFSWVWQKIGHLLIREMFFDQFGLFTSRLWLAPSPDQWE